jgi:hypothetical protein
VIIIVANRWDQTPRSIASHWSPHNVGILTARDLSLAGWNQDLRFTDDAAGVIERKLVSQKEISGVLTRLPCVYDVELTDIVPQDRGYVAAEMTAFLLFWLSQLTCPVLNRPTPTNLSGPHWRREKWVRVAAQAGIPVQPVRRHAALTGGRKEDDTLLTTSTLTVVGDRVFGESASCLHQQALCLAQLAGVNLLAVHFSRPDRGAHFVGANVFPDLSDDRVADAVLEFLQNGRR